jgi:hypothetical protein
MLAHKLKRPFHIRALAVVAQPLVVARQVSVKLFRPV